MTHWARALQPNELKKPWLSSEEGGGPTKKRRTSPSAPPGRWGWRVGRCETQTRVLAKGGVEYSAEQVEAPVRELGRAGARGLPRAEAGHGAGTTMQVH